MAQKNGRTRKYFVKACNILIIMGYFKQTVIGISWMSAFRVISRIITFFRVIILARLLTPAQFGVFGIATVILAFLEILTETGINVFLIQKKGDIDEYVNDAWLVSILRGAMLFLLIIVLSPFIVLFFKTPFASGMFFLISFVPLIRGFINPAIVKYQKNLLFGKEFFLRFSIFTFDSIIAIILALITHDEISFVWGFIAGALLEVMISFLFIKPCPKVNFKITNIKKIISRGKWVTLYGIFHYVSQEGDNVVVGRILGTTALGIYQMGYKLSTLPISEISDVVNKVIFPVYARIAYNKDRLLKAFRKTIISTVVPVLMLGTVIFILPKSFIILVLGHRWIELTTILRILAVYGVLRAIVSTSSVLLLALGKQNYVTVINFARLLTLAITIVPLTYYFGIRGASFSALLSVFVELPIVAYYVFLVFRNRSLSK